MPLMFSPLQFMSAINQRYSHHRQLEGEHLLEKLFEEAAPLIERRLGSYEHLRDYTWLGLQAFYDDHPGGVKETRGGVFGDHLKDQFIVIPHATRDGFEITNTKIVTSSRGKFNLFELLWSGWGRYNASYQSIKLMQAQHREAYNRLSASGKRAYREVMNFGQMTYYYRYTGSWFYNAKSRAGITPSLHDKFKKYVMDAVDWGVEQAIKNMLERGEGTEEMRTILEGMG